MSLRMIHPKFAFQKTEHETYETVINVFTKVRPQNRALLTFVFITLDRYLSFGSTRATHKNARYVGVEQT